MKNKIIGSILVVITLISIGGYFNPRVKTAIEQTLGSVVGPELLSPFFSVDGVRHEYRRSKLNVATTTPCAIKSPSATSTYIHASLQVNVATTTATTWTLATSTNAFATTSLLGIFQLASGAQGTMTATSSVPGATNVTNSSQVLPPNSWLVWGVQGTAVTDTAGKLSGVCQAEFVVTS